jgi:hypothetical protein
LNISKIDAVSVALSHPMIAALVMIIFIAVVIAIPFAVTVICRYGLRVRRIGPNGTGTEVIAGPDPTSRWAQPDFKARPSPRIMAREPNRSDHPV